MSFQRLYERARPGKAALLDAQQRQRIVALVSGRPRARWTVRLLTEEVVKRKLIPRVGRETIRVLLENHELKPPEFEGSAAKRITAKLNRDFMRAGAHHLE